MLLPVPFIPATNHVSSIVSSLIGTNASAWSTVSPASFTTRVPSSAQSACRLPDAHGHLPLISRPPSTLRTSVVGLSTPATLASGVSPKISCWACSGSRPAAQLHTLVNATTQAVDPHDSAIAAETSSFWRSVIS